MIMLGSKMFEEWALCHADVETMVWSVHFPKTWTLDFFPLIKAKGEYRISDSAEAAPKAGFGRLKWTC